MKKWTLFFDYPDGTTYRRECREFWARTGQDCFLAIRSECTQCVAGYQAT